MLQARTAPRQLLSLTLTAAGIYLGAAIFYFCWFWYFSEIVKSYGVSTQIMWQVGWRLVLAGTVFLLFGLISLIVSYGIFKLKKWALPIWSVLLICGLAYHLFRFIYGDTGRLLLFEKVVEVLFALSLIIFTLLILKVVKQPSLELPPAPPERWEQD